MLCVSVGSVFGGKFIRRPSQRLTRADKSVHLIACAAEPADSDGSTSDEVQARNDDRDQGRRSSEQPSGRDVERLSSRENGNFNLIEYGINGFLQPRIVDSRLVIGDILACFAVPNLAVAFLVQTGLYMPEWLLLGGVSGQSVALPSLGHGVILAMCWMLGALAVRAFEAKAVFPSHPDWSLGRFALAGIIAVWVLLMSNEISLLSQGISPLWFGTMGVDVDMKLIRTHVDIAIDSTLSALALGIWRIAFIRESGL